MISSCSLTLSTHSTGHAQVLVMLQLKDYEGEASMYRMRRRIFKNQQKILQKGMLQNRFKPATVRLQLRAAPTSSAHRTAHAPPMCISHLYGSGCEPISEGDAGKIRPVAISCTVIFQLIVCAQWNACSPLHSTLTHSPHICVLLCSLHGIMGSPRLQSVGPG